MKTGLRARTVNEVIDEQPLSYFQLRTIALCGLVLVLDGFDAQSAGFLGPSISDGLHIPLRAFGPIFASSLVGLMLAAMAAGPIADRWGRKWPVVVSTLAFAIFAVLTARSNTFQELLTFRFLTGLGLGGAMPNVVSIASEYSPKRSQRVVVAALFTGMPMGGFLCGLASSLLLPVWGWRSVFYLGGLLPLALSLVLWQQLPESVRFLAIRGTNPSEISRIMARISPDLGAADLTFSASPRQTREDGMPVKRLFTEGRAAGTILLWIPFFMNLLLLYFIASWLPALLRQAGMSISAGVVATASFSLGGIVGSLAEGPLLKMWGAYSLLLVEFGSCALFIGSLAFIAASFPSVLVVAFLLGFSVTAAQAGMNALAATFYPTSIRSTGVGWALGIGRIGSIVGPLLAGALLAWRWTPQQIFLTGAIPAGCAAVAVLLSHWLKDSDSAYRREPVAGPV